MRYLLILMLLASCGKPTVESVGIITGEKGKDGTSCSVSEVTSEEDDLVIGARLFCTDGSSTIVLNGQDGSNGAPGGQGIQGEPGTSCSIAEEEDRAIVSCPGSEPVVITDGQDGAIGPAGQNGSAGHDGEDGQDGEDGNDGAPGVAGQNGTNGTNGTNASGCTLVFKSNNGGNGKKYTLTCNGLAVTFTADKD